MTREGFTDKALRVPQHGEQQVLVADVLGMKCVGLHICRLYDRSLSRRWRQQHLAGHRRSAFGQASFEIATKCVQRDTGVVESPDRGILAFAQEPERDVTCRDIDVPIGGGDAPRDRERDVRASRERSGDHWRHVDAAGWPSDALASCERVEQNASEASFRQSLTGFSARQVDRSPERNPFGTVSRQIELPRHAETIATPAEALAESVVGYRHEDLAALGEFGKGRIKR